MIVSNTFVYKLKENFDFTSGWIPILKTGYVESKQLEITKEDLESILTAYHDKARGENIEIPVVSTHSGSEADGWVKDLKIQDNVLYALIEFTDTGKEKIEKRIYRYVSPEIIYNYKGKNGKKYKAVLFRIALTNIPALDLTPLDKALLDEEEDIVMAGYVEKFAYTEEEREKLEKQREMRSKKWGIPIREDGNLTPPAEYEREGATSPDDYADPVNYKYPISNEGFARAALNYFSIPNNHNRYPPEARNVIWERIIRACLKYGIAVQYNPLYHSALPESLKKKMEGYEKKEEEMEYEEIIKEKETKIIELENVLKEKNSVIAELEEKIKELEKREKTREWEEKVNKLIDSQCIPPNLKNHLLELDEIHRDVVYNLLSQLKLVYFSNTPPVISTVENNEIKQTLDEYKEILKKRR